MFTAMTTAAAPDTTIVGFYLGRPVEPVCDHGDGWLTCRWPDGKTYRHWAEQIKAEPWGDQPVRPPCPLERLRPYLADDQLERVRLAAERGAELDELPAFLR